MNDDFVLARKAMTSAISFGAAILCRGMDASTAVRRSGGKVSNIAVSVAPGWTQFERIPATDCSSENAEMGMSKTMPTVRSKFASCSQ